MDHERRIKELEDQVRSLNYCGACGKRLFLTASLKNQ